MKKTLEQGWLGEVLLTAEVEFESWPQWLREAFSTNKPMAIVADLV